jgi:hypothetical protein
MRIRACLAAALSLGLGFAVGLSAQDATPIARPVIWQIDLVPNGHTFAATQPVLKNGVYTFESYPEHAVTRLKKSRIKSISQRNAKDQSTKIVYQIELIPSGELVSLDQPVLKNSAWVFRSYRSNTIMSIRQTDVRRITPLAGEDAYWAQERAKGEVPIGPLAMQGGSAVAISSPSSGGAQAGAHSLSSIHGAPTGNWQYQGTPGTSDAYGPANATVSSPGGPPTMPAATNGTAPPVSPH